MKLQIAKDFTIDLTAPPYDTMGLRAFTSGMSGAGKSYTQMVFLEKAFEAKLQFLLLDVHGEGHVLGGLHAQKRNDVLVASDRYGIPVCVEAIPVYLDALENGFSVVLDLKAMFYEDEDLFFEFLQEFLSKFMAKWSKIATPILLAFDEAQEVMPQSPPKGIVKLFKTVKKIVLGGRKSGVHYLLASQRPALIDKTPISQANVRLFGKMEEEADWNAIKRHVKGFTYEDMKKLRSGEFILSHEGEARKIHVLKRQTVDAGATPSFEPTFTEVQKRDMDEIGREIEALIKEAREAKAKEEEEKSTIAKLERQLAKSKEREDAAKSKLDTLEFISERMSGKASSTKKSGAVPVDAKEVYSEVKAEFDKELKELGRRHQREMQDKDRKIEELDNATKKYETFMDAWKVMLSVGTPAGTGRVNLDIDAVVSQVLKRIPSHTGETYTVAPMEALKLDWQKDGMDRMYEAIDGLGDMSIRVISYMILLDKRTTGSNIAQALLGNRHGTSRNTISKAMAPLKTMFFVKATKNGFVQDIVGFVEHHLGYATEDITPFVDRVLERIRTRNGGD